MFTNPGGRFINGTTDDPARYLYIAGMHDASIVMARKNICPEGWEPITPAQSAIITATMRDFQYEMKKTTPMGFPSEVADILRDEGLSPKQVDKEIEKFVPRVSEESVCIMK